MSEEYVKIDKKTYELLQKELEKQNTQKNKQTKNAQSNKHKRIENVQPLRSKDDIANVKFFLNKGKFGLRNLTIFTIGINTGLRCSDIVKLRVKDVINSTTPYIYEQKTGKKRQVNLTNVIGLINEYIASQHFQSEDNYLFPSRVKNRKNDNKNHNIEHIGVGGFYKALEKVEFLMGRKDLGTHTMRKTFGYHFYKQTHDIMSVMRVLNHSKESTTKRYIGITNEEINDKLKNLNL
ncbi:tyrosine-type recombinase/integrase [Apilactobacillus timberlakei]|uniref:tyrosine-type recombinase/integrase n=1 Tax=Apilactobacillus timberlakei TaxID=2008380 RepID=UPI001128305E|nr:tyrosine-type recombinase/integrase [Apilactobacillus timberlakei]TPR16708.1 hypothetical protein DYZ95_06940 [Apilactobacillus timberlakei]TPR21570.1 hypothetical protein DY083_05990 [Apilactobacillus timberlakei]